MEEFFKPIGDALWQYIVQPFLHFGWWDLLDVVLLFVLLYGAYLFIKGRRAGKLAIGIVIVIGLYLISDMLGLHAIHQILAAIAPYTVILLAVIFQAELRSLLEKLGNSPLGLFNANGQNRVDISTTVNEVVDAVCRIALSKEGGALIVIERVTPLGEYIEKGQAMDALVSSNLLCNIFVDRSPLHDGAVIIRGNRIAAAGCKLYLSTNEEVVHGMGTRHRAAVGISELSDCVVVVVSEERHLISIANNGLIKRDYHRSPEDLQNETTMKNIQNALRNDLLLILAGVTYDESEEAPGRDKSSEKKGDPHQLGKSGADVSTDTLPEEKESALRATAEVAADGEAPEDNEIPEQLTIDQVTDIERREPEQPTETHTAGDNAPDAP